MNAFEIWFEDSGLPEKSRQTASKAWQAALDGMNGTGGGGEPPPPVMHTPEQMASRYAVTKSTLLQWFHQGDIPAEIAIGKVIRFDASKVAEALAKKTAKYHEDRENERISGKMVRVI